MRDSCLINTSAHCSFSRSGSGSDYW